MARGNPLWATAAVAVVAALLGAAVGGYASFRASEALEAGRRTARAKIRRKAKIYTPIRLELIELRKTLISESRRSYGWIDREEPTATFAFQPPVLWRWAELVRDGRADTAASPRVRELLDRLEAEADAYNATLRPAREVVKERAIELARQLGAEPLFRNWSDGDFGPLAARSYENELAILGEGPGGRRFEPRDEFVALWEKDTAAQEALDRVRAAHKRVISAIDGAIDELERAMKRIADRYEKESPTD